ncbi:DUF294 nucleotidyltransferase-like domain-containing protein [Dactylosporangium cerinum]
MLGELCDDAVPATHIGAIHAAVVDAAIRRLLHLQQHPALDGVRHSWVLLGSLARREPLPMSDVDTALVWADPPVEVSGLEPGSSGTSSCTTAANTAANSTSNRAA